MKKAIFENYVKAKCIDLTKKKNHFSYDRCLHAAVLTYKQDIISEGVNINLQNDFSKKYDKNKAIHAESLAIMRAIKHNHNAKVIAKSELWVCRNNQSAHLSRPCEMCQKIIRSVGIKKIHYTNELNEWVTESID